MNNQEAIAILIREKDEDPFMRTEYREQIHEALNMAIKALEQQDRIIQILDDYDLEAWEILEKIKEVVKE